MKAMMAVILLVAVSAGTQGQARRDPLNDREIEQLRETAQDPARRIEYLISYTRDRMLAIERLHSNANSGLGDADRIGDLLGDVASLIDELDDNLTMYNGHSEDLRKSLRQVLDAEAEFQKKMRELDDHATPLQKRSFAAALADASDSLSTSTESARAMLADQLQKKGELKSKEKTDRAQAQPAPGPLQQTTSRMGPPMPPQSRQTGGQGSQAGAADSSPEQ